MQFILYTEPRTKKNSMQPIPYKGRTIMIPSKAYKKFLNECKPQIESILSLNSKGCSFPLTGYYNVQAVYYMKARRVVDISNLHNALHDVLTACNVLEDDDCLHIGSTDGSFVQYDKDNPRIEVLLTDCTYPKAWEGKQR